MRMAFINTLTELARINRDIFLLTGDLGFSVLEKFQKEFPDRFFNIGVAEQNMIGIATGLALSNKIVFIYSIAPFVTMRCYEHIRNDVCYQNQDIKIIGVGGGLCYGPAGATHHALEDIAIMRVLPNMSVVCPGDSVESTLAIKESVKNHGPIYIRLGKGSENKVYDDSPRFQIGKAIVLKEGNDITLIATGNILYAAKKAAERLEKRGLGVYLISMHTIKPLDRYIILKAAKKTKAIFTIEEHSIIGGLGSAVSEVLMESDYKILFTKIALPDSFVKDIGCHEYLRKKNMLSEELITKAVLKNIKNMKNTRYGYRKTN